jgi:glycosyltransferase involved in cell wall biosynthesis
MKKQKALFVKKAVTNPKFMTNDLEILKEKYSVKLKDINTPGNILIFFPLLRQFFYLLYNIWKFEIVYIWFADYHSYLPVFFAKLTGKKSIICAGGYECTYIPEINCGVFTNESFSKRVRAYCVKFSLKNCSMILPVDETLIKNTNTYIYSDTEGKPPLKDGIKEFIPEIKTPMETIYLGYDAELFKPSEGAARENAVVSAGLIVNDDEFKRKGFDLLIEAAAQMPEVKFILIGFSNDHYEKTKTKISANVELHKILSYGRLTEIYSRAKVFAQISMFEGMPSTICEAMLCGCTPVGSDVNGIPRIIDGLGEVIKKKDISCVVESLQKALKYDKESANKARDSIVTRFSLETRSEKLLNTIEKLLKVS